MKKEHNEAWKEFLETGLLWFINMNLHIFGYAIVIEKDDTGEITNVYPKKVDFTGFSEDTNKRNYEKIKNKFFLKNNNEK